MPNETTDTRVIRSLLASTRERPLSKKRKKKRNTVDAVFEKGAQGGRSKAQKG
jgi:hypothetical protein